MQTLHVVFAVGTSQDFAIMLGDECVAYADTIDLGLTLSPWIADGYSVTFEDSEIAGYASDNGW